MIAQNKINVQGRGDYQIKLIIARSQTSIAQGEFSTKQIMVTVLLFDIREWCETQLAN